ncbi:MAG: tetratricopeptide repeat protein, partial [Sedimentisphaerales bacterium]|nr:tetratricopeptide repeat protein [Sedimentisphaerales bacterium]
KDIYELGMRYRDRWPQQARLIHRYNAEHSNKADKYTLWSAVELVKGYIQQGSQEQAEQAINNLMRDYSNHPQLGVELCKIGNAYLEVASLDPNDRAKGPYAEKAKALYQYVLDRSQDGQSARLWAKAGLIRLDIVSGKDAGILKAVDQLIEEYKRHTELGKVLFWLAEIYYLKATELGASLEPSSYYQRAIAIWQRITENLVDSTYTPMSMHLMTACYWRLGEYQHAMECYQKLLDNWPNDEFVPRAKLMINRCRTRLGMTQ